MHQSSRIFLMVALLLPFLACAQPGKQDEKKDIYADPQNLRVLPEDISSRELSETMKGFALGLGVRCETCHVGEAGKPLTTFDFQSDEKPMKQMARVMIGMMRDINENYISQLGAMEEGPHVPVRCVTCHRGQAHPELIEDVMDEQLAEGGIEAAVQKYAELRDRYYGSHTFDFSELTLALYAQGLALEGKADAAIALLDLNAGNFPESYFTHFLLAEVHAMSGNKDAALANYGKAIELNPRAAGFLEPKMDKLKDE